MPADWDGAQLEKAVFGSPGRPEGKTQKPLPDLAEMREQLQRHRHLTLQLIREEYRQKHPDGYSYSYFCERYERWRRQQDVVLRQEHRPGEKMFVDWAGTTIPIYHADGGITRAPLFVSALGVSSYTYAELTANQQMEHWLKVQMHAFEFYDGCPQLLVPDNTKTGVIKACRYEPPNGRIEPHRFFEDHFGVTQKGKVLGCRLTIAEHSAKFFDELSLYPRILCE